MLADILRNLTAGTAKAILAGIEPRSQVFAVLQPLIADMSNVRAFPLLDEAIEWAEDQVIARRGGAVNRRTGAGRGCQ